MIIIPAQVIHSAGRIYPVVRCYSHGHTPLTHWNNDQGGSNFRLFWSTNKHYFIRKADIHFASTFIVTVPSIESMIMYFV
jgi:hypothetical protein